LTLSTFEVDGVDSSGSGQSRSWRDDKESDGLASLSSALERRSRP